MSALPIDPRPESPERKRSARRSRSIRVARIGRQEVKRAGERAAELELDLTRPTLRSECVEGPRPCPHVACKHHLYLDVNPNTGTIKLNFPELEVWELADSCALDIAERGGTSLDDISKLMNVTRERVRQIETQAMSKLASVQDLHELRQHP
ncbi:MAG TPA: sigma factor-like helix-turn-helix DNA-binding protein [Polyangiaceae bacterium]|nr:sigma factor-like helix-turn-helix DNA-binding protein [Polyangiaceae bacterium]